MRIEGPIINKTVEVPAHTIEVLDIDAYWNLDYQGNLADEGDQPMCLYAKVAWPTLADAMRQFQTERLAREAEGQKARKGTQEARRAALRARKVQGRAYAAQRAQEAQA
jgi:hypothetical protein